MSIGRINEVFGLTGFSDKMTTGHLSGPQEKF